MPRGRSYNRKSRRRNRGSRTASRQRVPGRPGRVGYRV